MRLFLDECLSPRIATALNAEGRHVVVHPRDFGGLGEPDQQGLVETEADNLPPARCGQIMCYRWAVSPGNAWAGRESGMLTTQ